MPSISPAQLGPGKPAGLPVLVLCSPGPSPALWALGAWEGGRSGGEEERLTVEGDPPGLEDQGRHGGCFPHPLGPWEAC